MRNSKNIITHVCLKWRGNRLQVALQLIEMGADLHVKSLDGSTPLMDAARNNYCETVTALVSIAGADVCDWEAGGRTALHFASLNGHTATVKTLANLGAGVSFCTSQQHNDSRYMHTFFIFASSHLLLTCMREIMPSSHVCRIAAQMSTFQTRMAADPFILLRGMATLAR